MSTEKISVMVTSNKREQLQMAAMVASVGAVSGNDVSVFLSMNSLNFFVKGSSEQATTEGHMGKLIEEKTFRTSRNCFSRPSSTGTQKFSLAPWQLIYSVSVRMTSRNSFPSPWA